MAAKRELLWRLASLKTRYLRQQGNDFVYVDRFVQNTHNSQDPSQHDCGNDEAFQDMVMTPEDIITHTSSWETPTVSQQSTTDFVTFNEKGKSRSQPSFRFGGCGNRST